MGLPFEPPPKIMYINIQMSEKGLFLRDILEKLGPGFFGALH